MDDTNIGHSVRTEFTNFNGDWDTNCLSCGNSQRDHQVDLGEFEGVRYIHRMPCSEGQKDFIKKELIRVNMVRTVITIYDIGIYLWNKIPFKEEVKLLFNVLLRAYTGIRGVVHYCFMNRKLK